MARSRTKPRPGTSLTPKRAPPTTRDTYSARWVLSSGSSLLAQTVLLEEEKSHNLYFIVLMELLAWLSTSTVFKKMFCRIQSYSFVWSCSVCNFVTTYLLTVQLYSFTGLITETRLYISLIFANSPHFKQLYNSIMPVRTNWILKQPSSVNFDKNSSKFRTIKLINDDDACFRNDIQPWKRCNITYYPRLIRYL